MESNLIHGDCIEEMRKLPANSIETCITDPPYGLGFMGKDWDKKKARMRWVSERLREGHGLYDFTVSWAIELKRILKPGAMFLCFGGTRTFHRIACGIEDAGFELRDTVMWMHGQGFPKGYDVSKGVDRKLGAKRERGKRNPNYRPNSGAIAPKDWFQDRSSGMITEPASPEAAIWSGWNVALKPAWEPIIVAMKPCDGGFAENAMKHGVAGLAIDKGRVGVQQTVTRRSGNAQNPSSFKEYGRPKGEYLNPPGRWPANVILSHDPRCVAVGKVTSGPKHGPKNKMQKHKHDAPVQFGYSEERHQFDYGEEEVELYACVPGCPVRMLDEQSRGTSRFFYCAKASTSERDRGLPPGERNLHPTVKPLALMRYLCKLTATPTGGTVIDPFMGSGSTGIAARQEDRCFIGIEQDSEAFHTATARTSAGRGTVKRVRKTPK